MTFIAQKMQLCLSIMDVAISCKDQTYYA